MIGNYIDLDNRENMEIKGRLDFKERIRTTYEQWEKSNFSDEWITEFKSKWMPSSNLWRIIELVKAKKSMNKKAYMKKEKKAIKEFEEIEEIVRDFFVRLMAEDEALKEAGIEEGRVEYECPICGGTAVANRYMDGGRYHGVGSGCKKCGTWHT